MDKDRKVINAVYKCSFYDDIECSHCMLSFSKGERYHCAALGNRPICPDDGKRSDCPLCVTD